MASFLDENGLNAVWLKLKAKIAATKVVSHSNSTDVWGKGDGIKYGHLKMNDSTNSTLGIEDGTGATPYAVKQMYDTVDAKIQENKAERTKALNDVREKFSGL